MLEAEACVIATTDCHWINDLLQHLYHCRVNMCYDESSGPARPPTSSMSIVSSTPLLVVSSSPMDMPHGRRGCHICCRCHGHMKPALANYPDMDFYCFLHADRSMGVG